MKKYIEIISINSHATWMDENALPTVASIKIREYWKWY